MSIRQSRSRHEVMRWTEPSGKRVRKTKSVRRREIAEAALRIMATHGYYGTSVARIARAVGISNSALYQHFRNREDVLVAATELSGRAGAGVDRHPSGTTALERLDKIAESHLEWSSFRAGVLRPPDIRLCGSHREGPP